LLSSHPQRSYTGGCLSSFLRIRCPFQSISRCVAVCICV
jgi:hypothetical protein